MDRSPRRNGFTLIEMLVVLAIVGVLIGILAPVLANARTTARRTTCMANLRGIGHATHMCINDHDGILPAEPGYNIRQHNHVGYTRIYERLAQYLDTPLPPRADDGGYRDGRIPFLCPEDPGSPIRPAGSDADTLTRPMGKEYGFSYSYLAGLHMAPVWDADAVDPKQARTITFWYEAFPTSLAVFRDAGQYHPQSPSTNVKANNLYFDGSVDWLRYHPEWPAMRGQLGPKGTAWQTD